MSYIHKSKREVVVTVGNASWEEFNGNYYPTEKQSFDGIPIYSKTGRFSDLDENAAIIYFQSLNNSNSSFQTFHHKNCGTWYISKNIGSYGSTFRPSTTAFATTPYSGYYYSRVSLKQNTPPQTGWTNNESLPGFSILKVSISVQKRKNTQTASKSWSKILFSHKFSDVHFHFPDKTVLHAHKNILSTASPYFAIVFEGPWDDKHPNGVWKTSNTIDVMKIVLSFMYTGADNVQEITKYPHEVLSLAHEYGLEELVEIVEEVLIKDLSNKNVKQTVQASYLYNLKDLKLSCFEFIKIQPLKIFSDINFVKLAQENELIWKELFQYLDKFHLDNKTNLTNNVNSPEPIFCFGSP